MIYKQVLAWEDEQEIDLYHYTKILSCQMQEDRLCVWYLFDIEDVGKTKKVKFYIVGTGNRFPQIGSKSNYLGTVQYNGLVWHLFYE